MDFNVTVVCIKLRTDLQSRECYASLLFFFFVVVVVVVVVVHRDLVYLRSKKSHYLSVNVFSAEH